jgi:RNA polymerase sigma factor (sigma-70 family)
MPYAASQPEPSRGSFNVEQDDFDAFYLRTYRALVARAIFLGVARFEAENVVQEVMAKIYLHWPYIDWQTRSNYTFQAIRRAAVSWHRATSRITWVDLDTTIEDERSRERGNGVEQTVVGNDEAARAAAFIEAELSPRERFVLASVYQGYTTLEIGRELGITPGGVRSHLSLARAKVKNYWKGGRDDA